MTDFSPREIVSELDRFIIGQHDAKRAVAIALRNRWRRLQLDDKLREVVAVAGLTTDRIDTMILTGGSTRIPAILARLHAHFPEARFVDTDAFGSVGLGLALDARRKFS